MTTRSTCGREEWIEIDGYRFPPFDLGRLLRTVFDLKPGEDFGVFTDLPDPRAVRGLAFLEEPGRDVQRHAYRTLYQGLLRRARSLGIAGAAFYAYRETGASNRDLPDVVHAPDGGELFLREALARHTIVLFAGRYSATAPVTALAKAMGFRGATMHGLNDRILATGLAVDYEQVSARAERLRRAVSGADAVRLEWSALGRPVALELALGRQEAQKSHGLVRENGDVANLPAGEVYFVPTGAEGLLPRKFEEGAGAVAVLCVRGRRIVGLDASLRGDRAVVDAYLRSIEEDPSVGDIGELGFGTQSLPFAGEDIQDEKILGTAHVATGRSDHLGGDITPANFRRRENAAHHDILYAPNKTPEIPLLRAVMRKDGRETILVEDYEPGELFRALL